MVRSSRIDLRKIKGGGEFPCPTCGATISPDDYSGMTYEVLDTETREDGTVEEAILQCRGCRSIVCLEGFDLFELLGCSADRNQAGEPRSRFGYNSEKLLNNRPVEGQPEHLSDQMP